VRRAFRLSRSHWRVLPSPCAPPLNTRFDIDANTFPRRRVARDDFPARRRDRFCPADQYRLEHAIAHFTDRHRFRPGKRCSRIPSAHALATPARAWLRRASHSFRRLCAVAGSFSREASSFNRGVASRVDFGSAEATSARRAKVRRARYPGSPRVRRASFIREQPGDRCIG
jgi:hypothetical protein